MSTPLTVGINLLLANRVAFPFPLNLFSFSLGSIPECRSEYARVRIILTTRIRISKDSHIFLQESTHFSKINYFGFCFIVQSLDTNTSCFWLEPDLKLRQDPYPNEDPDPIREYVNPRLTEASNQSAEYYSILICS